MTQPYGWTRTDGAHQAWGDMGPWVAHLPTAWLACTLPPDVALPLPEDPTQAFARSKGSGADPGRALHEDLIAFWAPLLHLLCYGLGWTRPERGLARWLEVGAPTDDPILRTVDRWWSRERLADFIAWAVSTRTVLNLGREMADRSQTDFDDSRLEDRYAARRETAQWQATWGGGYDSMHLVSHAALSMHYPEDAQHFDPVPYRISGWWAPGGEADRLAIVNDTYRGWYAMFWHYRPTTGENGRSIRTEVVCTPVGWLGEFRHSRVTGLWFRGQHRWQVLGQ